MTAAIDDKRLGELRFAAEVGQRMSSLHPHTVHVKAEELASLLEEVYIARAQERDAADVACRKCGCTDTDCSRCVERTGSPCYWIERDLCSACSESAPADHISVEHLARGLCLRQGSPAAMILMLDAGGGLHLGCAAVDHPITTRFVTLAQSINIAVERGTDGFESISHDKAIEIARAAAKAKPRSYYAEPFEPHEWVVDAILQAASSLPPSLANCSHCEERVGDVGDIDTIRMHTMTCAKNPLVQELEQHKKIVAQAIVVARHWHDQDGVNSSELDKLKDLVFAEGGHGV